MMATKEIRLKEILQKPNNEQKTYDMEYKIFNLKDFLPKIEYPGVRKETKTEAYLEDVIKHINLTRTYVWRSFFQLVDTFYVVVEVLPQKEMTPQTEIDNNYNFSQPTPEPSVSSKEPVVLKKGEFPWKKK